MSKSIHDQLTELGIPNLASGTRGHVASFDTSSDSHMSHSPCGIVSRPPLGAPRKSHRPRKVAQIPAPRTAQLHTRVRLLSLTISVPPRRDAGLPHLFKADRFATNHLTPLLSVPSSLGGGVSISFSRHIKSGHVICHDVAEFRRRLPSQLPTSDGLLGFVVVVFVIVIQTAAASKHCNRNPLPTPPSCLSHSWMTRRKAATRWQPRVQEHRVPRSRGFLLQNNHLHRREGLQARGLVRLPVSVNLVTGTPSLRTPPPFPKLQYLPKDVKMGSGWALTG